MNAVGVWELEFSEENGLLLYLYQSIKHRCFGKKSQTYLIVSVTY